MENWLKYFLLVSGSRLCIIRAMGALFILVLICCARVAAGADSTNGVETGDKPAPVQVITPEVKPREVKEADIDNEIFGLGVYAGVLNIDNFGSEPVYGINAMLHATEDFFLQLNYAVSRADKSTWEELTGFNLLPSSDRDYTYYNLLVGYNIFPGEVFLTSKLAFNSDFYLIGGVGNTEFGGEDNFTVTLGTGYRIVLRDWLTWQIDYRDHIFKSDIVKSSQTTHNVELSTGVTFFF